MSAPSSEPLKLPMPVRKQIRDREAEKTEVLGKLSTLMGQPVTFEFDLPAVYATLASVPQVQKDIVNISLHSPKTLLSVLDSLISVSGQGGSTGPDGEADDSIRDELNALWHTHIYRVTVIDAAEWKKRMKEDTNILPGKLDGAAWSLVDQGKATIGDTSSNRTSLQAGVLETVWNASNFCNSVPSLADNIGAIALTGDSKLDATPGDPRLPLHIRFDLNKYKSRAAWDKAMATIAALPGLEDATFDFDATLRSCIAENRKPTNVRPNYHYPFTLQALITYVDGLSKMLTRDWKDEMVREGILEVWTAPHTIELVEGADVKAEKAKGMTVADGDCRYAVRLAGSVLQILVATGTWSYGGSTMDRLQLETLL